MPEEKKKHSYRCAIGSDHRGFALKEAIIAKLARDGFFIKDMGTYDSSSVDYPDFAVKVVEEILKGEVEFGILLCGTGIGMSISANRFKGIRASLIYNLDSARLARAHNNANVACIGAWMDPDEALKYLEVFFETKFEGGRHERRLQKIEKYAEERFK